MKRLLVISLATILLVGCRSKNSNNESVIDPNSGIGLVKSINDTVMYYFNPTANKMNFVMNLKYHKNGFYTTQISNDTLELGETFIGEVKLSCNGGKIKIDQPIDTLVDSQITNKYGLVVQFKPDKNGTFIFNGRVNCDSTYFPFEYKFIVIDPGTRKNKYNFVGKMRQGHD